MATGFAECPCPASAARLPDECTPRRRGCFCRVETHKRHARIAPRRSAPKGFWPRLVRQIAQISAGRVDVPCPFENTGHCRSRIFRPHRLAGVLVGAWTDAQHRSDHHSPTHPTYLKVRLRQVFGEDLLLNSVIKSTAVPGARRCRHPVAFATGLGLFAVIGPPFISLLDRAKGDVCEQR